MKADINRIQLVGLHRAKARLTMNLYLCDNSSFTKKLLTIVCALACSVPMLLGQDSGSKAKPNFLKGPTKTTLGRYAKLDVPQGYFFINGKDYRTMLKAEGEPVSGDELGMIAPTNGGYSVIFQFSDIGYVKDDEKDNLNADKLLDSIKRGTAAANKERERAGRPSIEVVGWEFPPKYDSATHNLEWAIRGSIEGRPLLNYNTRLLGRKGVMEVVLVVRPERLNDTLPDFRSLLTGYSFETGETYAEYRQGDKVAKYGLGALVLGGAAVGAAKLGLFTWLAVFLKKGWKLVVVAFAAVASFFKKLFTARSSNTSQSSGSQTT